LKKSEFFLGTPEPYWLRRDDVTGPFFVSRSRLARLKKLHETKHRWALDSGGFTQLHKYGTWTISSEEYANFVKRCDDEIGNLAWAAPQDWMCEETALRQSGLSVREHQDRTISNFLDLRQRLGSLVIPVIQGWDRDEYLECCDLYEKAGVDLSSEDVIGLGSVCRRNADSDIAEIINTLQPLNLHGFGIKGKSYIENYGSLVSADSMAWSFTARPLPNCSHRKCSWCYEYADLWRSRILNKVVAN